MTDAEIIKALEYFIERIKNSECYFSDYCNWIVFKDALDLINRLQAENKELQDLIVKYNGDFAKQEAEIEQLVKIKSPIVAKQSNAENNINIAHIEAEAYKEFAEDVIERTKWLFSAVSIKNEVDNLLKEKVGDKDES